MFSPRTEYFVNSDLFDCILPDATVTSSTKSVSSVEPASFFERVSVICNLWAPLAAKFVVPDALSVRLSSSSVVNNSSLTINPTLALSEV